MKPCNQCVYRLYSSIHSGGLCDIGRLLLLPWVLVYFGGLMFIWKGIALGGNMLFVVDLTKTCLTLCPFFVITILHGKGMATWDSKMVENSLKSYECDNLIFTCTIQSIYESILHWLLHIIWEVGGVNCLQTAFYYWDFFFLLVVWYIFWVRTYTCFYHWNHNFCS